MSLHLGALALYAGSSPTANIGINARPNETRGKQLLSGTYTRVGEVMERFEGARMMAQWDVVCRWKCRNRDDEVRFRVGQLPQPGWWLVRTG